MSEYFAIALILSERVEPDIPAYAFWYCKVALNPFSACVYLQRTTSGLYASKILAFGLLWPAT